MAIKITTPPSVIVQTDGTTLSSGIGTLNFGTGISTTVDGSGRVTISSSGGGLAFNDLSATNVSPSNGGSLSYNNLGVFTYTPPYLDGYALTASLATVATTGSYNDLSNQPTILTLSNFSTARATPSDGGALAYNNGTGVFTYTPPQLDGYLTGITSTQIVNALGYTPYNSTNPNGYTNNTGTVTSVGGTGTVNGITLTGTVTTSGNLTLGGTLGNITNSQLSNSTISGIALGQNLATLTIGTGLSGTSYNGSSAVTIANTGVTSLTAGSGISVSASTGSVTISNTGPTLTSFSASTSSNSGNGSLTYNNATGAFTYTPAATINSYSIGYLEIPQVVLTTSTTLALSDSGKHYYSTLSSTSTITIPTNATVGFNVGTAINIVNQGTASITISAASGVLLYLAGDSTAGNRALASYGVATLTKVATNTWFLTGVGIT